MRTMISPAASRAWAAGSSSQGLCAAASTGNRAPHRAVIRVHRIVRWSIARGVAGWLPLDSVARPGIRTWPGTLRRFNAAAAPYFPAGDCRPSKLILLEPELHPGEGTD